MEGPGAQIPALTIGLPVYNGERYLRESLTSLLDQDFDDFELIVADNASTDSTEEIVRSLMATDTRIKYIRHGRNLGAAYNHNFVLDLAAGEFFKWASDDDVYDRSFLSSCINLLRAEPSSILAHCSTAYIDAEGAVVNVYSYSLRTDSKNTIARYWSMLFTQGGDDFYGVIRLRTLKECAPCSSSHYAERPLMAELALRGRFLHHPGVLYQRRDHPHRAERLAETVMDRAANYRPTQHGQGRLARFGMFTFYVLEYVEGIHRVQLTLIEKIGCLIVLNLWLASHLNPLRRRRLAHSPDPAIRARATRPRKQRLA